MNGLFFAIGHEPATKFLDGQLSLDEDGYVKTEPGRCTTNIPGVFAAGACACAGLGPGPGCIKGAGSRARAL